MTTPTGSFYLGPTASRWTPKTWDDVIGAAAGGLLDESSWLELKADLPAANAASNLETARDLASLTLDGGLYVVGIRDEKGKAGDVVGADVTTLPDRIVQLAATRISPPLALRPHVVPHPTEPHKGCLVVAVPASPDAPHMVDQRYWGRSPDGKRPLNDPEVRRLLEARTGRTQAFDRDLIALVDSFDQIPPDARRAGHVFLLARPIIPGTALPTEPTADWPQTISHVTRMRYASFDGLSSVHNRLPHPDGPAAISARPHVDAPIEEFVHAVLVKDGGHIGEIHAFSGAGTFIHPENPPAVSPMVMVQLAHQMLMLADHVGRAQLGSDTGWQIGLHITGLLGATATTTATAGAHRYPHEAYSKSLTASAAEIADESTVLAKQLIAPLLRGLGASWVLDQYTGPDSIERLR